MDGRHQRAEEDIDDGRGLLRPGLPPRRLRAHQRAGRRARHDDGAELLQAGDQPLPGSTGYDAFIDEPLDVRNGDLYLSDRPGLGVELDRDYLEAHEIT